jgi:hypothetical protein
MWKSPFLPSDDEDDRFVADYHAFRRRVQERLPDAGTQGVVARGRDRDAKKSAPPLVEDLVGQELRSVKRVAAKTGRAVRFLAISVRKGDGMSWSASAVDQALAQADGKLHRIALSGRSSAADTPEIARVIGTKRLLRLASKAKVSRSSGLGRLTTAGLVGGFIVLSAAFTILGELSKASASASLGALLTRPAFLMSLVALPALGLAAEPISQGLRARDTDKALEGLAEALTRKRTEPEYAKFVDAVAERLCQHRLPRCVIVDGYERLDSTTQAVIDAYFRRYAKAALDYEVWVVFENLGSEEFGRKARTWVDAYGHRRTTWHEQLLLDDEDRRRLAERCGQRGQPDLHTVKAICGVGEDGDASHKLFFDEYRRKYPSSASGDGALELFYLLALGSAWGGSPMFSDRFLDKRLRPKGLTRQKVLQAFLSGTGLVELTKDPLTEAMTALEQRFGRYLTYEQDGRNEFRVLPEVGRFLADDHSTYGLPDPRLGHLFWALFWYDLREVVPLRGFLISKLMVHIRESLAPDALGAPELRTQARQALFDATLFAVDRAMPLCVLEHIPRVLARAQQLLEPTATPADVKRLLDHALEAYTLLGDEQLLSVIFELEARPQPAPRGEAVAVADPLDSLFLQSMRTATDDLEARRSNLAVAWSASDPAVRTYGQLRAAWLALTLTHFVTPAQPSLVEAASAAEEGLPELVRSVLARVKQSDLGGYLAIDVMSLSIGVWCLTTQLLGAAPMLQGLGEAIAKLRRHDREGETLALLEAHLEKVGAPLDDLMEVLEQSAYEAARLQEVKVKSVSSGGGLDFVLDVAASELFVIVSACAALASRTYGGVSGELLRDNDAIALIEVAMQHGLGLPRSEIEQWHGEVRPKLLSAIEHQMDALRATCGTLGLRQLTSFIGIHRADFHVLALKKQRHAPVVHDSINTLASEIKSPDFVGLLASATAARNAAASGESSAMLLCLGLDAALNAEFDRRLTTELCLLAMDTGSAFAMNLDRFLEYLLDRGPQERADSVLALLQRLPEEVAPIAANWLLNAVETSDRVDLARDTATLVRALASGIADSAVSDLLLQRIENFELRSRLRAGEKIDGDELVDSWKARNRSGPHYAWLLYLLLSRDGNLPSDKLMSEAKAVLTGYRGALTAERGELLGYSSYMHLATQVAAEVSDAGHPIGEGPALSPDQPGEQWSATGRVALGVLELGIDPWERRLSLGANRRILRLLIINDTRSGERWKGKLLDLDVAELERDSIEKLPSLVEQGQFFLLFKHYYDVLDMWGLSADQPLLELRRALGDKKTQQSDIKAWRASGQEVPPPFVRHQEQPQLGSKFLRYGNSLFNGPAARDPSLDGARKMFNEEAFRSLGPLYRQITLLPTIPIEIKGILERHRESLVNPTVGA